MPGQRHTSLKVFRQLNLTDGLIFNGSQLSGFGHLEESELLSKINT